MASRSATYVRALVAAIRTAMRPGGPSIWARLQSLPRLVRATARGEYDGTTTSRLAMLALGVLYVISPIDLVPEAILPLLGFADDAVVLGFIATGIIEETERFLTWERSVGRGPQAQAEYPHAQQDYQAPAGGPTTVRSTVVD